jgi:outer membrane protein assembly factor BamB
MAVAVDALGNAVITGRFRGRLDFGDPYYDSGYGLEAVGESDAFVAKFDVRGDLLWARQFGDEGYHQVGTGVAVDPQGNVVVAGWFTGRADFHGDDLNTHDKTQMFITKLDAEGNLLWTRTVESSNAARAHGVAVDGAGNIFAAGSFRSRVTIDGAEHTNKGDMDVVLLKLGDNGMLRWSTTFGDHRDQEASAVAVDQAGNVVVTGYFLGTIDLGRGPLTASGNDGFLAKLDGDGEPIWSRPFGSSGDQRGAALAVDLLGAAWMTGYFSEGVDLGDGLIASRGASDAFLVQLGP